MVVGSDLQFKLCQAARGAACQGFEPREPRESRAATPDSGDSRAKMATRWSGRVSFSIPPGPAERWAQVRTGFSACRCLEFSLRVLLTRSAF